MIIDLAVKIQTIQVGVVAIVVPPGAFKFHGTVITSAAVTVTIFGGKWISSVISKGISSGTLKKNDQTTTNHSVSIFHMMNEESIFLSRVEGTLSCNLFFC